MRCERGRGVTKGLWWGARPGQGEERASGPGAPRPSIVADGKTKWREGEPRPLPGHRPSRPTAERPAPAERWAGSCVGPVRASPSPPPPPRDGRLAEGSAREGGQRGSAGPAEAGRSGGERPRRGAAPGGSRSAGAEPREWPGSGGFRGRGGWGQTGRPGPALPAAEAPNAQPREEAPTKWRSEGPAPLCGGGCGRGPGRALPRRAGGAAAAPAAPERAAVGPPFSALIPGCLRKVEQNGET